MATADHKEPNYMGVFWALLILTLAEVGVFYLHFPTVAMIVSLVSMALVKAGLVAAYFMHLRFEKRTLAIIVISPLLLSSLMLIGFTPDSKFGPPRKPPTEWTLPGHEGAGKEHPGAATEPGATGPGEPSAAPGGESAPPSGAQPAPENQRPPPPTPPADGPAGP